MGVIRNRQERLLKSRARRMRRADTRAEAALWNALRDRRLGGWKWRRQAPIGPYIADFLCVDARLVIELDGDLHNERVEYDERRTAYLRRAGIQVKRFWNGDVLSDRDGVCLSILQACDGKYSSPARDAGEGRVRAGWGR